MLGKLALSDFEEPIKIQNGLLRSLRHIIIVLLTEARRVLAFILVLDPQAQTDDSVLDVKQIHTI
jgi:mRNA-degrading endonuclease toxin of MazEF toxin-antitoxin module